MQVARNDYRAAPLALCQDSQVKDLLLDVLENGQAARTALVKQMETEAAEIAAAEAARRLLEQRRCLLYITHGHQSEAQFLLAITYMQANRQAAIRSVAL